MSNLSGKKGNTQETKKAYIQNILRFYRFGVISSSWKMSNMDAKTSKLFDLVLVGKSNLMTVR